MIYSMIRGIGIASLFAAEGAKVVVCGRREEKGQAVVEQIRQAGGEASYHFMDITVPESIEKLMADTAETWVLLPMPAPRRE